MKCTHKFEDEFEPDYTKYVFYHGTSDCIPISPGDELLPPSETGVLREVFRKKLKNKVFFTDSLASAKKYARKACAEFGGNPVVYIVRPLDDVWHVNTNEYVSDTARILGVAA